MEFQLIAIDLAGSQITEVRVTEPGSTRVANPNEYPDLLIPASGGHSRRLSLSADTAGS
ncbi:hypothetical protein [Leifsonia shinshuensis]|uniref:hypothetical protein n=1 Tax=Leifsonia shinshuensis TaxID=150026 RepID=UPI001623A89C|nr:hypothetical protein [Leifsonia shinshuensis]